MVNRYGRELPQSIPEIDGFVGLDQLREVGDLVAAATGEALRRQAATTSWSGSAARRCRRRRTWSSTTPRRGG